MAVEPRIVCLVPSVTELLCDLGLAGQLVGRTGFCIHPRETVREIPKVGGTKDLKLDKIRELAPTHVVVNVDENRREDAEAIAEFAESSSLTRRSRATTSSSAGPLGGLFGREEEAEGLCGRFERAYARRSRASARRPMSYLI